MPEPAFEYAETLHKAEGLRQAIEALLGIDFAS
jgi:hypothetical protein